MKARCLLVLTLALAGFAPSALPAAANEDALFEALGYQAESSQVTLSVSESDAAIRVVGEVAGCRSLRTPDDRLRWRIDGEAITGVEGRPDLPAIGRWVALPPTGEIRFDWRLRNERAEPGEPPALYFEPENASGGSDAAEGGLWPPHPIEVSEPMIMRGVRMALVRAYPVRWDGRKGEYLRFDGFDLKITRGEGQGRNEVRRPLRRRSKDFDQMLQRLLLNAPHRDQPDRFGNRGGMVVVVNENAPQEVMEFVHWKNRIGHPARLLRVAAGITPRALRDQLREVYNEGIEAGDPFEFLLLMGQSEADEALRLPFENQYHDIYYGQLEGDDMLPDVAVGTFDCFTEENLICAIRRAISYQSGAGGEDDSWFTRAGVAVGHCSVPQDLSPSYSGQWVAALLRRSGYEDLTTHYWAGTQQDNFSPMIADLYNEGASFILVRGHQSDFDEDDIDVGTVFPFHFLTSSATIRDRNMGGAFSRAFHMGAPDEMRGPSAGFGHYSSPRTNVANALAGGLTQSLFLFDIGSLGWARNYTVANLARVMVADGVQIMPYYYSHWRFYGDPSQGVWSSAPVNALVISPEEIEEIDRDASDLLVMVITENGEPINDALVTLYSPEDGTIASARSDQQGRAYLIWEPAAIAGDEVSVTAVRDGIRPAALTLELTEMAQFVTATGWAFDDRDLGNGDGGPNPGESGPFRVELTNVGDQATGDLVMFEAMPLTPWCELAFRPHGVDNLDPGESRMVLVGGLEIVPGAPDGEPLPLHITLAHPDDDRRNSVGAAPVCVGANPELFEIVGQLEAGEASMLSLSLVNRGGIGHGPLQASLRSLSPFVAVTAAAAGFPAAGRGQLSIQNENTPFRVRVHPNVIPGQKVKFELDLVGNPGVVKETEFSLPVGAAGQGDPLGPDAYGYIALDNGDDDLDWIEAPEYDWVEICPWRDERRFDGEMLPIQFGGEADSTVLVNLPFNFRYYGQNFRQISVCSNGWAAVGNQTDLKNQQNWPLPGFNGAFGMMAVFWDRLEYTMRSDGLFGFYDRDGGRYIIEWIAGVQDEGRRGNNAFQLILYDPAVWMTPTGDSPFLYQYQEVNNVQDQWEANPHSSVGISSPDGLDGITYSYWNVYPEAASPLQNQRAILWTTAPAWGQVVRVSGRVTRFIDSTAVAWAWVRAEDGPEVITGNDGRFTMLLPPGRWPITAGAPNYGTAVPPGGGELVIEEGDTAAILLDDVVLPHLWLAGVPQDTLRLEMASIADTAIALNLIETGNLEDRLEAGVEVLPDSIAFMIEAASDTVRLEPGGQTDLVFNIGARGGPGEWHLRVNFHTNTPQETLTWVIILDAWSGVDDSRPLPLEFGLHAAYPNPFNSTATIRFELSRTSAVKLELYDLTGRFIQTVAAGNYTAGRHTAALDGGALPTGVYLLRLQSEGGTAASKVVLMR